MEAHASDEWPIGNLLEGTVLNQHKLTEERLAAAQMFQRTNVLHPKLQLLVDPIDNCFNQTYQSWPTRAWVISADKEIVYKSMPGDVSGECVCLDDLSSVLSASVSVSS
jgi:hypothetical protein